MPKKEKIRMDMTFGEVIEKYPWSAMIMMKHGLHCVGCHVAAWETIEQGAAAHGMSKEDLDKMMKELNSSLEKKKKA
jgi:hybrid cluster-associated redox disulfide protein